MAASLVDQELHSDQRTAFDPRLYVLISAEFLMDGGEDGAASGLIQNGSCPGGKVYSYTLLEVERKLGMRQQVSIPVAGPRWSPRDIQMPLDIVEPYLDATGLPGFPSPGGNVDEVVMIQGVLHLLVHMQSPVRILFGTVRRHG
jgi:hypothetical protein